MKFCDDRNVNVACWFLIESYGVSAPAFGVSEYCGQVWSARFGYSPAFIYLLSFSQFVWAIALLVPKPAILSLAVFTVISLGAVGSHVVTGLPLTAISPLFLR